MNKDNILIKAFKNLKNKLLLMDILNETKEYVRDELGFGEITQVIKKTSNKFFTCPNNSPIEYCTKDNMEDSFLVNTSSGEVLIIKQIYYGLNFEAPCDSTKVLIYDEYNNLLFDSSVKKEDAKTLRLDK